MDGHDIERISGFSVGPQNLPETYVALCKQISECKVIEEVKMYGDKAAGLAAFYTLSKMRKEAAIFKRIQLRASIQVGKILAKLSAFPSTHKGSQSERSLARMAANLSQTEANLAIKAAAVATRHREKMIAQEPIPTLRAIARFAPKNPNQITKYSEQYRDMLGPMVNMYNLCRKEPADLTAQCMDFKDVPRLKEMASFISDWVVEFERNLPR
jgi:hypothetical protein